MRKVGLLDHWEYHSSHTEEPGIHAPNGARALILSADNRRTIERLRGLNLAWWWIDEEAEVDKRARDILTQRLRVGDYRNGFITTTPKGENHTYDFFVGDVDGQYREHGAADIYETDDRLAILRVPSHANPNTPDDYKEQLDRDHDGQFYEQEVLGKFVQFEGLIYPWFGDDHVVEELPQSETFDEVIYGVDWGFNNPSVILALGRQGDQWTVLEEFYERRCTVGDMVDAAQRMADEWGTGRFYCDPAEASSIEEFSRSGLDARQAANDVTPGIQEVTSQRDTLRVAASCQNVRNEFKQYQYKNGGDSDDPEKKNDHAMDALRYALFTHDRGQSTVSRTGSMTDLLGS
jgi:PBSX family phage terminase large subunit